MRWLLIAFLASLGALLIAVAGVVRHVRLHQRTLLAAKPLAGEERMTNVAMAAAPVQAQAVKLAPQYRQAKETRKKKRNS